MITAKKSTCSYNCNQLKTRVRLSTTAIFGTEDGSRCGDVVQRVYCAKFVLTVSHNDNQNHIKNFNSVSNQNVLINETKRAKFTTFARSIVDNLRLLQQYI